MTGLVALAALVRFPYLWSMPLFTDETMDSLRSLSFYQGQRLPLTNVSDYVGGLYNWLEAVGFLIFGANIYTPRLWACLLGSLAITSTYFLAREMVGRPAGWLAAAMLATSGVHVGGNSHVAWSQETTPLFLALGLALLYRAIQRQSGPTLLGAGFVCGLALQTHATVIAFVPGVLAYFVWKGRRLLRTRWPYLAACLFLVAYSNMIVYNLSTGFHSIKTAKSRDAGYSDYRAHDVSSYLTSQGRILLTVLRLPAGAVDGRPDAGAYLTDPLVLLYDGLVAAGLVLLLRAGNPLPGLVIASAILVFPMFGAHHDVLPRQGRYLAPLLPLMFTAVALAVCRAAPKADRIFSRRGIPKLSRVASGLTAVALLILLPLLPLQRYYADGIASGQTNERFFRALADIEASRRKGETVLLDTQLDQEKLGGGGTALMTFRYMLTMRGIAHTEIAVEADRLARRYASGDVLLVLGEKTYRNWVAELPLEPPPGQQVLASPNPYGVYRLGPAALRASGAF